MTGAAGGALNALLITRLSLPPLIVTLATLSLFRGIAEVITKGAVNYSGFDGGFLALGQGYLWQLVPAQLGILVARRRRVRGAAASIDDRARDLRHRLHGRWRAVCRHSGGAPPGSHLRAGRPGRQHRRDRLRGAPRPGEVRCGHGVRARRDHGRGARRHVRVRRARPAVGHGARPVRDRRAEERTAAGGVADGAGRRAHRRAAGGIDCGGCMAPARGPRRLGGYRRRDGREEQSGRDSLHGDPRRRAARRWHQRVARADDRPGAAGVSRRHGGAPRRRQAAGDRRDAEGQRRSVLRQLPGRRRGGGA